MNIITPIITPIVESLIIPVKRHLDFMVSSTKYVRDVHVKLKELIDIKEDMQRKKDLNDANNLVVPRHVPDWLVEVEEINKTVESIPTNVDGCFNIKMRYKAGKQCYNITKDLDRLMGEILKINWTDEQIPLGMINSTKPTTYTLVHDIDRPMENNMKSSRDLIFDNALKSLDPNNTNTQLIALSGMGGVGKTTIMEQLKKAVEDRKMFDLFVKVVIGKNRNIVDVQQVVADYIGLPLREIDKDARAERLRERFDGVLKDGKKNVLVILDDVWHKVQLKDIGLRSPLPKHLKLLLTSREEHVCTQMGVGTSSIFRINVLEEQEARKLFWEIVGSDSHDDPDLHQIGEDIVKRCSGLPIAIITIASTLRGNIKDAWEDTLLRLRYKRFCDVHDFFEISYNNLKEEDDKETFLLCGLFPDDYNIPIEELVRYAWGLKLFMSMDNTISTTRRRVKTCVNNLIHSNLLIESDNERCVRMHDLVRDFVLTNFSKVNQASIVNHDDYMSNWNIKESYERILLKCTRKVELPIDFKFPNLALLKIMDGYNLRKFPEDFYTCMVKLEVVDFEMMQQPLLPQFPIGLRTLCLISCSLEDDISFLGDLVNLEVLSLAYCSIRKLPSTIGKLRKLKLLDLSGCFGLLIDDGVFKNLERVEELYMKAFAKKVIRFTDSNCDELYMLSSKLSTLELEFFDNKAQPKYMSFEKLERFKISLGCQLEKEDKHSYRNTLKLVTNRNKLLECKINELLRKTEELDVSVDDLNLIEEILPHPSGHSLCNLKVLSISNCEDLTCLFTIPVANGMMKLERLTICSCPLLESLIHGENRGVEVIKFPKLKLVSLKNLPKMVSLCSIVINLVELPHLDELLLDDLPKFTAIFSRNDINISTAKPFFSKEVVIPKLEKLKINLMKNLKEIWSCSSDKDEEVDNNIPMLREIEVFGCDNVVDIFPVNPLRFLSHLQKLSLENCGSIEVLFNIDLGKTQQLSNYSNLRRIKLYKLKKLKEIWRIKYSESESPHLLISAFQAVESICIRQCEKFRNIFTPTTAYFDLRALKSIEISYCGLKQELEYTTDKEISSKMGEIENNTRIAFLSHQLTHTFHELRQIQFDSLEGLDVVFEIETKSSPSMSRELVTTPQQPLPLLPYLEELELDNMDNMTHVWKCNWNEFLILHMKQQPQSFSSFQNLTTISLNGCKSIKYLFSPLMANLLSNLKTIDIDDCFQMEEVVSNRDDVGEDVEMNAITLFPRLDSLTLYKLRNIKHIGGVDVAKDSTNVICDNDEVGVISWSLCQYCKHIQISGCNALSSVIPSYVVGEKQKIEELKIYACDKMMEVFETKGASNGSSSSNNVDEGSTDTTLVVPRPTNTTMHKLVNLKRLNINNCEKLEYVFTFSTLESLRQLERLTIKWCKAMKVIVREENGEQTTASKVVFRRLKSIKLKNLPNLEGFIQGKNDFEWPLLDVVEIKDCHKMKVFTHGVSTAPMLKYIYTELGKHECGLNFGQTPILHQETPLWSFQNLIEMDVGYEYTLKSVIPSNQLLQPQKLEKISVSDSPYVEEVFEVALEVADSDINESKTVVKFPKLRELGLVYLDGLKCIWKNNRWRMLQFPNLTTLSIKHCDSLKHILTCSMVGSLAQLQELHISDCGSVEVIVKEDDEHEKECDTKVNEIKFPCLKSLHLEVLKSLKGFFLGNVDFSLPSLNNLVIKSCPKLATFTMGNLAASELKSVETSFDSIYVEEDINSFIIRKKQEGLNF